jgi:hypothetical protein
MYLPRTRKTNYSNLSRIKANPPPRFCFLWSSPWICYQTVRLLEKKRAKSCQTMPCHLLWVNLKHHLFKLIHTNPGWCRFLLFVPSMAQMFWRVSVTERYWVSSEQQENSGHLWPWCHGATAPQFNRIDVLTNASSAIRSSAGSGAEGVVSQTRFLKGPICAAHASGLPKCLMILIFENYLPLYPVDRKAAVDFVHSAGSFRGP